MILEIRFAPPFMTNGFVLGCAETREGVIIDPGDCVEELIETATELRLSIKYILLTHAHLDHVTGVGRAKAAFAAPVGLHRDDLPLYEAVVEQGRWFDLHVEPQPPVDFFYDTDDTSQVYAFGGHEIRVHHTPGHSPGGVCLRVGPRGEPGRTLIVGDTLFAGSIGRTDLPGGNLDVLLGAIRTVLLPMGDESVVYPGHGDRTTIGRERRTNPFLTGQA
jgi:glyoxylase-like metal-dependent hydrolase (beta-lactamase superfamily II)